MNHADVLITGEIYHIYTKSIYDYDIFNRPQDYQRFLAMTQYYQWAGLNQPFSHFVKSPPIRKHGFKTHLAETAAAARGRKAVEIIAYCIMTTHLHFLLKQTADNGISRFMQKLIAGYSLYFNLLHNRHGPLWQSRFGRRQIEDLGDLIITSHYVHANPVKDAGRLGPADWFYTSYHEYCMTVPKNECLCQWQNVIPISPSDYQESMTQYLIKKGLMTRSPSEGEYICSPSEGEEVNNS